MTTENVSFAFRIPVTFVRDESGWVFGAHDVADPGELVHEVGEIPVRLRAGVQLVFQRPDDDAGVVAVAVRHSAGMLLIVRPKSRIGDGVATTVAPQGGLFDNEHAEFIGRVVHDLLPRLGVEPDRMVVTGLHLGQHRRRLGLGDPESRPSRSPEDVRALAVQDEQVPFGPDLAESETNVEFVEACCSLIQNDDSVIELRVRRRPQLPSP